jgi:hypothetical protein
MIGNQEMTEKIMTASEARYANATRLMLDISASVAKDLTSGRLTIEQATPALLEIQRLNDLLTNTLRMYSTTQTILLEVSGFYDEQFGHLYVD